MNIYEEHFMMDLGSYKGDKKDMKAITDFLVKKGHDKKKVKKFIDIIKEQSSLIDRIDLFLTEYKKPNNDTFKKTSQAW